MKIGTNAANNAINKGVNYMSNKTGSDTVKQIANVVGNMAKDTVSDVAKQILGKAINAINANKAGAGYDISDLDNETSPIALPTKKESNPQSNSTEREQDREIDNSKERNIRKAQHALIHECGF